MNPFSASATPGPPNPRGVRIPSHQSQRGLSHLNFVYDGTSEPGSDTEERSKAQDSSQAIETESASSSRAGSPETDLYSASSRANRQSSARGKVSMPIRMKICSTPV